MRSALRLVAGVVLTVALVTGTAAAQNGGSADAQKRMDLLFTSDKTAINSDLAFWGNHAFHGYYRPDISEGGFRIFDISDPSAPSRVRDFPCDGAQNDPIVWDRNGNGVADLMMLAVDRTMATPECGAARAAHNAPNGWEGVRIFTMSDNPANPFATITQVKAVYTDCGAHTITAWPGEVEDQNKLMLYVSSYPLRPGPTCGSIAPAGGVPPYQNTANPFDEDPGSPNSSEHGVIQVIEVPLNNPALSQEIDQQPPISYPGDPDGVEDWCERSVIADDPALGGCEALSAQFGLEPAAVACHDIMVHVEHRLAGAACAEQGQVWNIDGNGIPDTANPILIGDDQVSSGGSNIPGPVAEADIPGAVDFFHSVMFNNNGTVVNWVDESFVFPPRPAVIADKGCPPMTPYQDRPWHPAGVGEPLPPADGRVLHKTGRMFFTDLAGNFLSEFQVGNRRPDPDPTAYCSAHMGMTVLGVDRDILVNAWYMGGVNVIDFTRPRALREIAFYDIAGAGDLGSENWSAYPYTGPKFPSGGGIPVYASDGVHNFDVARGMVVFRADIGSVGNRVVDHLNPQTMDQIP
jgi:hypothetical protein